MQYLLSEQICLQSTLSKAVDGFDVDAMSLFKHFYTISIYLNIAMASVWSLTGNCTWGMICRFIHPGVNDKGNYSLISTPDPFSPNGAPPGGGGGPHPLMPASPWVYILCDSLYTILFLPNLSSTFESCFLPGSPCRRRVAPSSTSSRSSSGERLGKRP